MRIISNEWPKQGVDLISNNLIVVNNVKMKNEHKPTSRNIPDPMKRQIRQKCGFGCVICGNIIYDYDHMINDWAQVKEHIAEDITLLCLMHHREKTNGLLTREQVEIANKQPYNLSKNSSPPYLLHFSGNEAEVVIANNVFTNAPMFKDDQGQFLPSMIPILIDGVPMIGFRLEDERLLLYISLYNRFNELIFVISDNQLIFKPDTWDVEWKGSKLTIREKSRVILLEMEFCPPGKVIIRKAKIRFNGVNLELKKDHFVLNGEKSQTFTENYFVSNVGISIGQTKQYPAGIIYEQKVDRYS